MTTPDLAAGPGLAADGAQRLARFKACESAEDYFAVLGVDYDPRVLAVSRLHILRHFAGQIIDLHRDRQASQSPEAVLADYRDALARSYQEFTTSTALDHRLFKVLQDQAPRAFVPVASICVERGPQ